VELQHTALLLGVVVDVAILEEVGVLVDGYIGCEEVGLRGEELDIVLIVPDVIDLA
jgi:hypothetical protein